MSGGKDKGKGKKEERHSTRKGAGTIDKFTYKALGTGGGTKIALRGTPITISSDEEYEDVASLLNSSAFFSFSPCNHFINK